MSETENAPTPPAVRWPHIAVILWITATVILVFAEPLSRRLSEGFWARGRFVFVSTASLDAHALSGALFVFIFLAQVALGWRALAGRNVALHRRAGKAVFAAVIPAFAAVALWVTIDRSTNIAPEDSVIFSRYRGMTRAELALLVGWFAVFMGRAWLAVRRGDIATHVDSVVAAFASAGAIGVIRFVYAVFWAVRGGSPFSVAGMFFVTMALVIPALVIAFALAGRLRQNARVLAAFALSVVLLGVAGIGHFSMWDRP